MDKFIKWQNQKRSLRMHLLFLGLGLLVFPLFIPAVLIFFLPRFDHNLGLASFYLGAANIIIGLPLILVGGILALWTIIAQIKLASGTPFPMIPTKKLIIIVPFRFCRNPMTLGTIMAYSGIAVMKGSYVSLLFVVVLTILLILYLKLIEEKELALRFGNDYREYQKETPFIIPLKYK